MSVVKLDHTFRGLEWRKAFANRLIQLRPDMNPDAADEVSDSEFLNSSSFSPLDAADRYAESETPSPENGEPSEGEEPGAASSRSPGRG